MTIKPYETSANMGDDGNDWNILDISEIPLYSEYYKCIINQDQQTVQKILLAADEREKGKLLNGQFKYPRILFGEKEHSDDAMYFEVRHPLFVAAVIGAIEVLDTLLEHGADFATRDINRCNLFHALVAEAFVFHDKEQLLVSIYNHLLEKLPSDVAKDLLYGENSYGLRPIEFASALGCFQLLEAIFETRDVYLIKTQAVSATIYKWYDISDYEAVENRVQLRGGFSPLQFFMAIPEDKISDPSARKLARKDKGIFGQWLDIKKRCYQVPLMLWAAVRVTIIVIYFLFDADIKWTKQVGGMPASEYYGESKYNSPNRSNNSFPFCDDYVRVEFHSDALFGIRCFLLITASVSVLKEFADFIKVLMIMKRLHLPSKEEKATLKRTLPHGQRPAALQYLLYICSDILSPVFMVAIIIMLPLMTSRLGKLPVIIDLTRILTLSTTIYSAFFILQIAPFLGPFVITINRMMMDVGRFFIVLMIFLLPASLYLLIFVNLKSDQGCIEPYSDFPRAVYTTFSMILNLFDVSGFKLVSPGAFYVTHVLFLLFIGVLLMNFLIGILSNSVVQVAKNKNIICTIQYLSVIAIMELRFWLLLKYYYRWMQRKHFPQADGKWCVVIKVHPSDVQTAKRNIPEPTNIK